MKPRRSVGKIGIPWCDWSGGCLNFVIRGKNCPTSLGCEHCYVERDHKRFGREMADKTQWFEEKLTQCVGFNFTDSGGTPFRRGENSRPIAFPCDYGDIGHYDLKDWQIQSAFRMMACQPGVDFVVLTKRIQRFSGPFLECNTGFKTLPSNIWLGTSIENNGELWRLGELGRVSTNGLLVISFAPLLEDVAEEASNLLPTQAPWWAIVEGESGFDRRSYNHDWGRHIRAMCHRERMPFFLKQGSADRPDGDNLLDGKLSREFPILQDGQMRITEWEVECQKKRP